MGRFYINAALLVITIFLASCGGSKKSPVAESKLVQIAIWEDRREPDSLLYQYLSDSQPEVRARACYALGLIAPEKASAQIANLLTDPEDKVRLEAAFALGLLGDSSSAEKLKSCAQDADPEIRHQAIISLGKVGGAFAIAALDTLAGDLDPKIRAWAAEGLWRANAKGSVDKLIALCDDDNPNVKWNAVYALRRLADKSAVWKLRARLRDTIPEIRMEAANGLAAANDSGSLINFTDALARETDWRVKASLISAIRKVGDKRVIKSLSNLLTPDEHPLVISEALNTAATLKITALIPKIHPFLKSDNRTFKGVAINVLIRLEDHPALELIGKELPGYDWFLRFRTAEALQYLPDSLSLVMLEKLFVDKDSRVRAQALASLAEIKCDSLDKKIESALTDPDLGVEATAIDLVARAKLEKYLDRLMALYQEGVKKQNSDLCSAVLSPLENWVDSLSLNPKVKEILEQGLEHPDRSIRSLAIAILAKAGIDKKDKLGYFSTDISQATYGNYYGKLKTNPLALINTDQGQIKIELFYDQAPKTVVNFIKLAESGFYNNVIFHRVVPNFVIQGGDPRGDGMGGPGYTIRCEYNRIEYKRGTVGMAHAGKDTGGSQFFICHSAQPHLNARYTAFGQVISGMRVVDQILIGDMIKSIEIIYAQ